MCIVSVCKLNILPLTLHQVVPCRPRRLLLTAIAVTSVTRYLISAGSGGSGSARVARVVWAGGICRHAINLTDYTCVREWMLL
mgnify:CR=1 FL=1